MTASLPAAAADRIMLSTEDWIPPNAARLLFELFALWSLPEGAPAPGSPTIAPLGFYGRRGLYTWLADWDCELAEAGAEAATLG